MNKYVGLDVHATSCTAGIIDQRGKRLASQVIETKGTALVAFFKAQRGTLHVCLEEGTQSAWLVEILSPIVARVIVVAVPESRGQKSDEKDAFDLAESLRIERKQNVVFKAVGPFGKLRMIDKARTMVVRDVVRTQNRIKSLYRARGVHAVRKEVYGTARVQWLARLPPESRAAADILYAQYDALTEIRDRADKELVDESHKHPITEVLETCPGLGKVRAAQLVAIVVTPDRFRTRSQFWNYCGLGIVTRSSSDWVQNKQGRWVRAEVQQTRGLNRDHNHTLKAVFKGAAKTVVKQYHEGPLYEHYQRLLAGGTPPHLATLTLARQIASISLAMWQHKEVYDPAKNTKPTS